MIKLADFGIAKFKKLIDPTITLSDFVSRPFAPPEPDSGDFTYTRDVFAFAVVALHALSEDTLHTHDDVVSALDSCNLPDSVHGTLSLALSEDPAMRQVNGAVLLSALDQIAQERHSGSPDERRAGNAEARKREKCSFSRCTIHCFGRRKLYSR